MRRNRRGEGGVFVSFVRFFPFIFVLGGLAAPVSGGWAQEFVRFSISTGAFSRQAVVEALDRGGIPYVSLLELAQQAGAGARTLATRVQVDFEGLSAWMAFNSVDVNSSLRQFRLRRPILREGEGVLIAAEDVPVFFTQAFRVTVRTQAAVEETPVEPATEPAIAEPDEVASLESAPVMPVIILDAGHGGGDGGAQGAALVEKDLALKIAEQVKANLEAAGGVGVELTRNGDRELSIHQRVAMASKLDGSVFVSIHAGAGYSAAAEGVDVFYSPWAPPSSGSQRGSSSYRRGVSRERENEWLAGALAGGLKEEGIALHGARLVRARLLGGVDMPACLVEVGNLSNGAEEGRLASVEYQGRLARGLAAGIRAFLARETGRAAP